MGDKEAVYRPDYRLFSGYGESDTPSVNGLFSVQQVRNRADDRQRLARPENGGAKRCLILDVRDNIQSYDRTLAFSDLDWLWAP